MAHKAFLTSEGEEYPRVGCKEARPEISLRFFWLHWVWLCSDIHLQSVKTPREDFFFLKKETNFQYHINTSIYHSSIR